MICKYCKTEIDDNAAVCPNCQNVVDRQKASNPVIAAILSVLITGVGQMYAGKFKKGLLFFGLQLMFGFLVIFTIGLSLIPYAILWAYAIYDAYKTAKQGQENQKYLP